ncbi:hypothetical protein BCS96_09180 [Vibrio breoganii]|uniref:ATP-binding protein n=1 Tax=Vibrio breoganii TaxID=553239 RepID=UPI000C829CF0|nr:type IV secretion system DNA-binding domain-containing protein [Vibrio breoganii]PML88780.1 hypothetical protein BCT68_04690 [Vibrio breoganii]PMO99887.1 hypothetical protein BCS96_09180 [Vibrio breoganii]
MNLFVKSLDDYLKQACNETLSSNLEKREARFIVQSMGAEEVFQLFSSLEEFRLEQQKHQSLKCYFRVATGLWNEWCSESSVTRSTLVQKMDSLGAVSEDGECFWIDEEDKLTWYRNRTVSDEEVDNLIIVLVGLNHATDQGGLSDFHKVDEARIWHKMKHSFVSWLIQLCERLGIDVTEPSLEPLDAVLCQLFELRPLQLSKLASFLETELVKDDSFYSLDDIIERFFSELPYWGLPPMVVEGFLGKSGVLNLKNANKFISHQSYKSKAGQNKDWKKIEKWFSSDEFEMPTVLGAPDVCFTVEEYKETLRSFIFEASIDAREKLFKIDLLPLLSVLSIKESKEKKARKTIKSFSGTAFESILRGLKETLVSFQSDQKISILADSIEELSIEFVHFDHDMISDDEEGVGGSELAEILLVNCLGGIDTILSNLDCRLPCDDEENLLSREHWSYSLPITAKLNLEDISFKVSRTRPKVLFRVTAISRGESDSLTSEFYWQLPSTQAERVQAECVRLVRQKWQKSLNSSRLLPAFSIQPENMSALYYAADEDEANRLVSQAMTDMEILNLLEDLPASQISHELNNRVLIFIDSYKKWLDATFTLGFHSTVNQQLNGLLKSYIHLIDETLSKGHKGSVELLRRLYKAFFIVDRNCLANDAYLSSAVAWGLSPAVLEQMNARIRFLSDGFPEVIGEIATQGDHQRIFDRLMDLSQIKRPVSALVNSENTLTADMKSYSSLHYLGGEPENEMSLAVQTLLRETENEDENIKDSVRPCQETKIVSHVIEDYMKLYPYSHDGLRILAANVKNLQTILSGLEYFLERYISESESNLPFHFTLMIYTSASSPMVMENRLKLWQEQLHHKFGNKRRPIVLTIGHKFASASKIPKLLSTESKRYDIAFLFHFLEEGLQGRIQPAKPFEFKFDDCAFFPVAEYPRPIDSGEKYTRHNLISNRRLRAQSRHADMSAKLCFIGNESNEHLVYGKIDFQPWLKTLDVMHDKGNWIACIDPFVDKKLLTADSKNKTKIVGFSSGLGSFGELNVTISSQLGSLKQLTEIIVGRLKSLFAFESTERLEVMAVNVVREIEEIVGLSSLRAIVGEDERIREVIGFAAIHRALKAPNGIMSQLLPLDDLRHWFADNESKSRPDLLQLTLELRENDLPLIHANLVECKLGKSVNGHFEKAYEQITEGLSYLPTLLAPKTNKLNNSYFDRRYWWAQLHRALSSRSNVHLSQVEWQELDYALEQIADGEYEIHWRSSIFTFWTDSDDSKPKVVPYLPPAGVFRSPFVQDSDFAIQHVEVGYKVLSELFSDQMEPTILDNSEGKVSLKATMGTQFFGEEEDNEYGNENEPVIQQGSVDSENGNDLGQEPKSKQRQESQPELEPQPQPESKSEPETEPLAKETGQDNDAISNYREEEVVPLEFLVPDKILLGKRQNGEPVYWHFGHPKLANRHMLIFGSSGSGKTYGIQCLLSELSHQSLRSFIIDYTNGFLPSQIEQLFKTVSSPKDYFVRTQKLPLNPFRRQQQVIDPQLPAIEESPFDVANRIASIFTSVFPNIGDQQSAALIRTLTTGLEVDSDFSFDKLLAPLREENKQGESLANKLQPFVDSQLFSDVQNQAWEQMLRTPNHWVHTLQLATLSRDIQKIVTEFALWDLWDYLQNSGNKDRPIPVVLDEIQNLDHSDDSPIDKMLREGRKFGLSLILATQTTSQFNQEQRDRLFQAGHKLFFKPASTEVERFANILAQSTPTINKAEWMRRLNKLEKGQCWSLGPVEKSNGTMTEEPVLVSITPLEDRVLGV